MRIMINKLYGLTEKVVQIKGFVAAIRNQGGIAFLEVRDTSGSVQVVVSKQMMHTVDGLTIESVVAIIGSVVKTSNTKSGLEIKLESLEILSLSEAQLPIPVNQKADNEATQSSRRDWRWLDLRNEKHALVFKIWTTMEQAFREYCIQNGFTQIHSPKTVVTSTESGSELFEIKYFEKKAYLAQSPQLYKQMAMASGLERVFEIGPVFRANPSFTSRHDTEFTMYDIEMSYIESHHDLMDFEEQLMRAMFESIDDNFHEKIKLHYNTEIAISINPFPRIKFVDAKQLLSEMGVESSDDFDLSPQEERKLCEYYFNKDGSEFVFVHDWYSKSRAFYSMRTEDDSNFSKTFDLLYRGLEITSGAQREHRHEQLSIQIQEQGLELRPFESYLNFFRFGCPPHGGFAPGPTRILMKMLQLDNVRDVTYLYRGVNRITP